jgi:hypothetical protein
MISATPISAIARVSPPVGDVVAGDGPSGGLSETGKSVILWGLPFRSSISKVEHLTEDFTLAQVEKPIVKVPMHASCS